MKRPLKIVFCYAHEDESLLNKLKAQLRPLRRQGLIEMWHDREISAGAEWEKEIDAAFNIADIILLLVSSDFMDSEYCYGIELQKAMERHRRKEACVIPIILRHVYWRGALGELQALPTDAKPVMSSHWYTLDEGLYNIVEGIQKVVEQFTPKPPANPSVSAFQTRVKQPADKSSSQKELPVSQGTLALLLGASEWPLSPDFQSSQAFVNTASAVKDYLQNPSGFGLPKENMLDLFNSDSSPDDMDRMIRQFLNTRLTEIKNDGYSARYLLVYFVGHTGFARNNDEYFLATRRTRMESLVVSSIPLMVLADTLSDSARYLRKILILDADFAGAAVKYFEGRSGETSLLCSSSARMPSLLSPDEKYTMFTEALLHVWNTPSSMHRDGKSLRDIARLIRDFLHTTYGEHTSLPEVHSPSQGDMDVADCPFFP